MKTKFILFLLTLILLNACLFIDDTYEIKGRILYNGSPCQGVEISLYDTNDYRRGFYTTDSTGNFRFNIHPDYGENYWMRAIKTESYSSCIIKTDSINISSDLQLPDIKLEKTLNLSCMSYVTDMYNTGIELKWTSYKGDNFKEYRVFKSLDNGLGDNELFDNNGSIIKICNAVSDTVFIDKNAFPLILNYYRVDVLDGFGKIGQSNIINVLYQPDWAMGL